MLCTAAIMAAQQRVAIPDRLLLAIAIVETGRPQGPGGLLMPWPWTINAEGAGQFFDSKAQAIAATEALLARGVRSIDVGCMQINLFHHPKAFVGLDEAFEPRANADYAARFLRQLYEQTGTWPTAAGAYHSETPDLAAPYRQRVLAAWGKPETAFGQAPAFLVYYPAQNDDLRFRALPSANLVYRAFLPPEQIYAAFLPGPVRTRTNVRPMPGTKIGLNMKTGPNIASETTLPRRNATAMTACSAASGRC